MPSVQFPNNEWRVPEAGNKRFVLLDGAQCNAPCALMDRLVLGNKIIDLFDGTLADGSGDASVKLAQVSLEVDIQLALQRAAASIKSFGAVTFIDSTLTQGELTQRLMRRLDARLPNGKEFLARFYDGRVLPWLLNVMTQEQKYDFFALGSVWRYVAHNHVWLSIGLNAQEQDPYSPPLRLDDVQRRQLLDDTYPYTLIDHFELTDEELLNRIPVNDQYRFIRKYTRLAAEYGMRDGKRVVMVCAWALLLGEDYHLDAAWQQRLSDLATGKRTARDIGNEVWPIVETWD